MIENTSGGKNVWDTIYREKGMVQGEVAQCVEDFCHMLHEQGLSKARILDAGAGTGRHAIHALQTLPESTVDCFDMSEEGKRVTDDRVGKLGDAYRARYSYSVQDLDSPHLHLSGPYDAVFSILVIHHGYIRDMQARIARLDAEVKPGGYFVIAVASERDPRAQTGEEVEPGTRINTAQADGYLPHHYFTLEELSSYLPNYELINASHVSKPMVTAAGTAWHWECIYRKKEVCG